MALRLVLFDIDGTLIRTGGAGVKAFGCVLASQFGVPHGCERISFAGRTDPSIVREIFLQNQITPSEDNIQRFYDGYVFYLDHLLAQMDGSVMPGVRDWLHRWRSLPGGPRLGLLTGNIRLGAEIKLRHFGLWDKFETGGFGDDHVDRNQIAAAAKRRGQALLGMPLRGDEILVVGDTPLDIACARHIGARVLAVATGPHTVHQLREHNPDWAVADLREINMNEVWSGE